MAHVKKPVLWFKVLPQVRKRFDETALRQLGESLKVRQLQALNCLPDGTIVNGERRYRAALLVGIPELEVRIIDDQITEAECKRLQFTENIHRENLSGYEQWQGCVELWRFYPGWTQKQLADALHLDPSMVTRLLSPSKCVESVQAAFAEGKIGISDCYAICRLPVAEQAAALTLRLNGASRDALASHARRKQSGEKTVVRTCRVKCELAGGLSIVVAGDSLGMDEVIEALGAAQKEARKARDQSLDVKTWVAVMRDRARNDG